MLKIRAIKINVNTTRGLYGFDARFSSGLNIVRGDNSSGKSTIFQSILYCLGMEELIGSKNDKAMQSVLKNEVLNEQRIKEADVVESSILLEIENQSIVTIERYVRSEYIDSKLVKVFNGALLTGNDKQLQGRSMYVHDSGSATDSEFGFFAFLESFLQLNLPEVKYNDNSIRKLYLQTIFPAFVIEQKVGWSDFLATIPFFNLKDKEKRAIEFILKLDSWRIEEKRQEVASLKSNIEANWQEVFLKISELARRSASVINGIESKPFIINELHRLFLSIDTDDFSYTISEYIDGLSDEISELESQEIPKIEEVSREKEKELSDAIDLNNILTVQFNEVANNKNVTQTNIISIQDRLYQIEEELTHNKHHLKVKKLASEHDLSIGFDICPTCRQPLLDSLLPSDSNIIPMNIEQNIEYLDAQKSMAKIYLENHRRELTGIESQLSLIEEKGTSTRDTIRAIRKDLVSDGRLPSEEAIVKRIKLRTKLNYYNAVESEFEKLVSELAKISEDWKTALSDQEKLPKESFSKLDFAKLRFLNEEFIRLLQKFDFGSKSLGDLSISKDKLIPVAEGQYNIKYNMRLDSSASDLVRAIAAYVCSLFKVSEKFQTNHPMFIMLDEPGTQETAISSLKEMFKEMQSYDAQSIIFASFKQSDNDFKETTDGLKYQLIKAPGKKFITKK